MEDTAQTIGVYLEEICYFLEDMSRDLWWLVRLAHLPGEPFTGPEGRIVRGDEDDMVRNEDIDPEVLARIEGMKERADHHLESHEHQARMKVMIIPGATTADRKLLQPLKSLKFHCKGRIEVFPCMKEANNSAIWGALQKHVAQNEPQWLIPTDGLLGGNGDTLFAQCIVIGALWVDGDDVRILGVWCPEQKKRHWALPGGDVLRGADQNLAAAARRKWCEQVGMFFDKSWEESFTKPLPEDLADLNNQESVGEAGAVIFSHVERDGVRYPTRPYLFARVSDECYRATRERDDARGVITLNMLGQNFVRWDDEASRLKQAHTEGHPFVAHDEATWLRLDFETGKLSADDGRPVRREHSDLLRQRPAKVWNFLGSLVGRDPPLADANMALSEEGPWIARVSGIDKQATDDDLINHFIEKGATVKTVEQFEVPKHTARVEFGDASSLKMALALNNSMLQRRKVKVEIWVDDGSHQASVGTAIRSLTPFEGVLSEEGPFFVRVSGLDRSVDRDEIGYFFYDRDCLVKDVIFPLKAVRHAADIELETQESCRTALGLNGAIFKGREVTVTIRQAGGKEDRSGGPGGGGDRDRGKGSRKGKGSKGGGFRDRDSDEGFSREFFGTARESDGPQRGKGGYRPSEESSGYEPRPTRLQLKPRSVDAGNQNEMSGGAGRPDPFGGARPTGTGGAPREMSDPFGGVRAAAGGPSSGMQGLPRPRRDPVPPGGRGFDEERRKQRFAASKADDDTNWRR